MMARAATSQAPASSLPITVDKASVILASSRGTPIVPVEATNTSVVLQPRSRAAFFVVRSTEATPATPLKALALPELTITSRALPPLRPFWHQSTGAEAVSERVNTPATVVPGASSATIRSSRPW